MHIMKNTLMTAVIAMSAVAFSAIAFSSAADAKMMNKHRMAKGQDVIVNEKVISVTEVPIAGSRRVGMVGGRPYPVIEGIAPIDSGGVYFTEDTDVYYSNPAVDVEVYSTGQFNN